MAAETVETAETAGAPARAAWAGWLPWRPGVSTRSLIVLLAALSLFALLSVAAIGGAGIYHMSRVEDHEVLEGYALIERGFTLQSIAQARMLLVRGALLRGRWAPDTAAREEAQRGRFAALLAETRGLATSPEDARLTEAIAADSARYDAYAREVLALARAGKRDAAIARFNAEGAALKTAWLGDLDALIARQKRFVARQHETVNAIERDILRALGAAAGLFIPLALALAVIVLKRVLHPLRDLEQASRAIAEGEWQRRVPVQAPDELGAVAVAFNSMAGRVERAVTELQAVNGELQRLDRQRDEFLSTVSHELKTPLNYIRGFASLLEREYDGPLSAHQREHVANILSGAERMEGMVRDLLDVATIRAGKLRLLVEPVVLAELARELEGALSPLVAEKGIALEVLVPPELVVQADGQRLAQVLTNLIANAVKFTHRGGRVIVSARPDGPDGAGALIEVTDTGIGIAEADQQKLFEPFTQLDMTSTRRAGGTGLGLSICKALVEAHGGAIGVRSRLGEGSTFWVRLPR